MSSHHLHPKTETKVHVGEPSVQPAKRSPDDSGSFVDTGVVEENTDNRSKTLNISDGEDGSSSSSKHVEESTTNSSNEDDQTQKPSSSSPPTGNWKRSFSIPFPRLPFPKKIPRWAMWTIGSLILLAIPFNKKVLRIEGMMEKVAGAVIDEIQAATSIVKKISGGIADSLPTDSILGKQIEMIENLAEDIEEGVNEAEIWLDKVDEMTDKMEEALLEPIVEATTQIQQNTATNDSKNSH